MSIAVQPLPIETNAPVPTWFGVGGGADALVRPETVEELKAMLAEHAGKPVRILGDGANLLVDDAGVDGLVVSLERMRSVARMEKSGAGGEATLRVGAGVSLARLITDTVRDGLGGLETLAGVPASVGGAIAMNAGGSFGQIADVVRRVRVVSLDGQDRWLERDEIRFAYRQSGLTGSIICEAELALRRCDGGEGAALRDRMKEIMALKKKSQPMAERSAGCFWKNPPPESAPAGWTGHRSADGRIGAGWLIDQAGLKGLRVGGASVSEVHANFVVTDRGPAGEARCTASDVLALMRDVRARVADRWSIVLEPEVAIWRRGEWDATRGGRAAL